MTASTDDIKLLFSHQSAKFRLIHKEIQTEQVSIYIGVLNMCVQKVFER